MTTTLYLIGTGPGALDLLTPKAKSVLNKVTDLVGYDLYLTLLGDLCQGKKCHTKALGAEIERAELALNLAAQGKSTALISSGDIGIYAMATLVFELLDQAQNKAQWQAVKVEVIPGISAMQVCASEVGAILGHDFCTISLSDLLTPWAMIEKRIKAAAEADFVIAFYNPRSEKRYWQIKHAKEILLANRPQSTPVILGRQLSRLDQNIDIITLAELNADNVDMFTLVCVGNSETRQFVYKQGQHVYTPRGYENKGGF